MVIKAVVFDFDGTVLDTEACAYDAICGIYREFGHELTLDLWSAAIGTRGGFDPYGDLEQRTGRVLDRVELEKRYRLAHEEQIGRLQPLPGVLDRLKEARGLGLRIGMASASYGDWIKELLTRQGIRDYFEVICSADDVEKVKPDPALYRLAVESLGVKPEEAFAVEDSVNGLRAAKAAGLHAVAVPNTVTAAMDFALADLVVPGLDRISFADLAKRFGG